MKKVFFLVPIIYIACANQPDPEQQGWQMLHEARSHYAQGQYEAARDTVLSLRRRFPTALDARRQAILLMDSIEQQLAQGDSLKQEFFRRKLEHDLKELGNTSN